MSKRIVDTVKGLYTASELIEALTRFAIDQETTYVRSCDGEAESIRLDLEEERLTDGSFVYNIIISGHRKLNLGGQ